MKIQKKDLFIIECDCSLNGTQAEYQVRAIEHEDLCFKKEFTCNLYNKKDHVFTIKKHLHKSKSELDACLHKQKMNELESYYLTKFTDYLKAFKCKKGHDVAISLEDNDYNSYITNIVLECYECDFKYKFNIEDDIDNKLR